jgi:hypothetical protein
MQDTGSALSEPPAGATALQTSGTVNNKITTNKKIKEVFIEKMKEYGGLHLPFVRVIEKVLNFG